MDKIAFLYPGQGSQAKGMGLDLIEEFSIAKERYQQAEEILGWSVKELSEPAGAENIDVTLYTQPALYTLSFIVAEILISTDIKPSMVAGHSAGEYPALATAGAWDFETGLRVISERARLMHESQQKGMMAAVLHLDSYVIDNICFMWQMGTLQPAGYNSPKQTVITGDKKSIESAIPILKEQGAKRVVPLATSNAFHSRLMIEAQTQFAEFIQGIEIKQPEIPLVSNNTGLPVVDPDEIRLHLIKQFCEPVRWVNCMNKIHEFCDVGIETGPGNVLCGLAKACHDDFPCFSTSNVEGLNNVLEENGVSV